MVHDTIDNKTLKDTFNAFDKDGSGSITADELKEMLGGGSDYDPQVWNQIISEVDQNGDGEIDLKEFMDMMLRLL